MPRHRGYLQLVIPAQAGIQLCCNLLEELDSGLRRNDEPGSSGY
jgi:hypothetical protein